jgi:hypothetical protein
MAQTVGQHGLASFTNPSPGDALDAAVVKANDNSTRDAYVDHDSDSGIHVQSSAIASRPVAGVAGRKWMTTDTGSVKLWFDTGSAWEEIVVSSATNAATATALQTARTINGVAFDGTANITVPAGAAAAGTLTGTTLASNVTASSLTSVGTLAGVTVGGDALFSPDATYDIGASGATRPRNIYTSGDATIAGLRVGRGAGAVSTNVAVGASALNANTTGVQNTASGQSALTANTTGSYNTVYGSSALVSSVTSSNNTAIGHAALLSNSTGAENTAVGVNAGYGSGVNSNTTGTNNTFIGASSVGASATASNVITLGNASVATLRCQVTTITSLSDVRDKTDILPIPAGLAFINALTPVSFVWNMRDGGKVGVPEFGFIAQDLQQVQAEHGTVPHLVSTENPDKLEASAGTLIPVLVKAIQELTTHNTLLAARVAALEAI